jgi:hypothetical protein
MWVGYAMMLLLSGHGVLLREQPVRDFGDMGK